MSDDIPFNQPYVTGREFAYIKDALGSRRLAGDGKYTDLCERWFEHKLPGTKALLTHSGTAALEMAALLLDLQAGDEVIMPSYTFTSTANAFVLRGAIPVFVDIRADTLNIDEGLVEAAITTKTKGICVVHYAGVACEMDRILEIAANHDLPVIEDAAQAMSAFYKGRPVGCLGHMAALSFHETKNIISGEGGALLVNDEQRFGRAEILREKGTNRRQFFRGQVDKYTWVDTGSSYLPSDLIAAVLWAQLAEVDSINAARMRAWEFYHRSFAELEALDLVRRPAVPAGCQHNAHMYYLMLRSLGERSTFIEAMKARGIATPFHYLPLHSAPAGRKFGRAHGDLRETERAGECLVRLPLWVGVDQHAMKVVGAVYDFFKSE